MSGIGFFSERKAYATDQTDALTESLAFIEGALKRLNLDEVRLMRTLLLSEEVLNLFLAHATPDAVFQVKVRRFPGDARVMIRMPGTDCNQQIETPDNIEDIDEQNAEEAERIIRNVLFRSQAGKLTMTHKNGVNAAQIRSGQKDRSMVYWSVIALILGVAFGLFMRFLLPNTLSDFVQTNVLNSIQTMFMSALKIVIGPVVFFSIACCISQFKDISEFGRIGVKIFSVYLATTVIAILIGAACFALITPGDPGFAKTISHATVEVNIDTDVDTSLLHTIVNIVPSNFVQPFLNADTLQIIFLAVIFGLAVGMIGEYAAPLQAFFEAGNALFTTVTTMIARFIPLGVFVYVSEIILTFDGSAAKSILSYLLTLIVALICMMTAYGLIVLIFGRLNPLVFFKKNREGMLTSFSLASSSAAVPTNMRIATENMGISPKVSSFSIPLGATINMDGTTIFLAVTGLFLARGYGIAVPVHIMASLALTIILLSMGCPGVPGAGIICLGIVLNTMGVPIEGIGIIMGVSSFADMMLTMSNTTGDMAATIVVAKNEGLLDREVYYKK